MAAITNLREFFLVDWTSSYSVVPPAWTLMYELYFYAWTSVAILMAPRRLKTAVLIWIAAHILLIAAARLSLIPAVPLITDPILIDFGAGALIGMAVLKGRLHHARIALVASAIFLAAGLYLVGEHATPGPTDRLPRLLTFGSFAICLIYAAIALEGRGQLSARWLQALGDASYSLYLWHVPVFWLLNWTGALSGFYSYEHPYLTAAIWFVLALPVGLASYRWIERPLLTVIRGNRAVSRRRRVRARPAASPPPPTDLTVRRMLPSAAGRNLLR